MSEKNNELLTDDYLKRQPDIKSLAKKDWNATWLKCHSMGEKGKLTANWWSSKETWY